MKISKILKITTLPILASLTFPLIKTAEHHQVKIIKKNTNSNIEYNFVPIQNFTYVYDGQKIDLKFNLQNKFEKLSYTLNPMQLSIHNNLKNYMKYFSNELVKNTNDENIRYFANDLKDGEYKIENDKYVANLAKTKKQYKVKLSCGKKHSRMNLICKENHMHMRGCFKTTLYWCTGCIDGVEEVGFDKTYDPINFDKYIKNNAIINDDFDFSNLLQIDYLNSYKSFDKNILSFTINKQYLESIILGSFNYAYATKFFNENNYIKDEIKQLLSSAIYLNKLIVLDHKIPNFFGYNTKNINKKHNLRYWIENIEHMSYLEIKNELNNLETLSFSKYLNKQNIDIKNPYIGKLLFNLFSDENKLKNIYFNIDYLLGNDKSSKTLSISIYNLMRKQSNKIIYEFKNNIDSNLFDNQKISIIGNNLSTSNNKIIYVENHKLGISQKNNEGLDEINKINNENKIVFNEELNFANLIKINSNNNLETYLKDNNIFKKPSENINENTFRILTNFNKIISFKDKLLLNNIPNDVNDFGNVFFKEYIKNYELIPNDLLGSMDVLINFVDSSSIKFKIYGFDKVENNDFILLKENINLSSLDIKEIKLIDKNYVENNLISYSDDIKKNSLFKIPLTKDFFIKQINYSISINFDNKKNANIDFKYDLNNSSHKLSSKIFNDLKKENYSKNKTQLLIIILPIALFLTIIFIIIYLILKNKKNKKN